MHLKTSFVASVEQPVEIDDDAYWFVFCEFRLLVLDQKADAAIPKTAEITRFQEFLFHKQYLGYFDSSFKGIHCYAAEISEDIGIPEGMAFLSLRKLFGRLEEPFISLAGRAIQITEWDRTHQYCGRCGVPVEQLSYERAKKCPQCGLTSYPRLAPAIIVRVERQTADGKKILLARNHRHPKGFYSVLAGFVEPGESLEDCVRREIHEEVGIEVKNIRYFGSQPWPFPHSLMIAFTAEYKDGDIVLEEEEISHAGWFSPDNLPKVPPPVSIARQLIDNFVEKNSNQR